MKDFFRTRSYEMVRMFLNQIGTGLFGVVLALACAGRPVLRNSVSVCAILFYLFLLYYMTWEIGFKDKVSVEAGRKKRIPQTGLLISLCANIPNFVCALIITLAKLLGKGGVLSSAGGVCTSIALVLDGMYTGLLANYVGGAPLNSYWWTWFVITIPSMLVCWLAYYLGLRDIKYTRLFNAVYPESDREPKKKKKDN